MPPKYALFVGYIFGTRIVTQRCKSGHGSKSQWIVKCTLCGKESKMRKFKIKAQPNCVCTRKRPVGTFDWGRLTSRINHRGRQLKLAGRIKVNELKELWEHSGHKCVYCKAGLTLMQGFINKVQWDHKSPLSRGGQNTTSNLAPSCAFCNHQKGDLTSEEFMLIKQDLLCPLFGLLRKAA